MADPPSPNFKPTPEQTRGYATRVVAQEQRKQNVETAGIHAIESVGVEAIKTGGEIIRELVGAAKANPLIGVCVAVISANVLYRLKVIDSKTEMFIFTAAGVAFGVSVASEIVNETESVIRAIDPFSSGGSTAPDPAELIKPVPTTIVENPVNAGSSGGPTGAAQLAALVPKLAATAAA